MAEGQTKMKNETDMLVTDVDDVKLSTRKNQGSQIVVSEKHGNWLTVGELIHLIQKPISIYVDRIVKAFHQNLCKDLLPVGNCSSPHDCNKKTKPSHLCKSCKCWLKELEASHRTGYNRSWRKNCNSAKWCKDSWEVAKFFMPALGSNLGTVKDAESTDPSSLLNVLEWMKDPAFLGETRVNVDLVRKLRSQVRNTWAHAPQQEMTFDEKTESFSIANDILEDLEKVFHHSENGECQKHLKHLDSNGVTNVAKRELQSLLLQRRFLNEIGEEITEMKAERLSDKSAIEAQEQKLIKLECALKEWSQRMSAFDFFKQNIYKQFNSFADEFKSFRTISEDIHEIRNSIEQVHDDLAKMNTQKKEEGELTSSLPDRVPNFTARETEIQNVISLLMNEENSVVSLHGGPGFGKTAIANQVSQKLSGEHDIPVIWSQLTTATTIDEMIRRLCIDLGVNYEHDDPKPSLIFRLKRIKARVVIVMDDIDNLLEENNRPGLYDFIHLLGKIDNFQMITTSRLSYLIPGLSICTVDVVEMDDKACMQLLREQTSKQDVEFLRKLAKLCGNIPLAMCIAASQVDDFDDNDEFFHYLEEQPFKALERPKSNLYVYRAINMSYERLDEEQKETIVRFAAFDGSFTEEAASFVVEKEKLDAKRILNNLVCRSLIKQPTKNQYSIHLLIKHFLRDQLNGENEIAKRTRKQAMRAKLLMVKYYLKLGHDLTIKSYSKDGYKEYRESLKQEAHNIQNVLKICCQQRNPTTSDIPDCLANSKIYTTSARFFSLFARTVIPGFIVDEFLQRCAHLAKEKRHHAIKIDFDCLLADQERSKSIGKSDEYFNSKMEEIMKEFEVLCDNLQQDSKSICAHYHYQCGRYLLRKAEKQKDLERLELQIQAREQLEKSLKFRKTLNDMSGSVADKVFSLLHLGIACRIISSTEKFLSKTDESKKSLQRAEECYGKAIEISQQHLGEHELTSACYKSHGDLYLKIGKHGLAEEKYTIAKNMRENLGLHASERHAYLLNNLGVCLTESTQRKEAIEVLESARDLAENLAENDEPNVCKAKIFTTLAIAHNSVQRYSKDAAKYAEKAKEFKEVKNVIGQKKYNKLCEILSSQAARNY